MAPGGSVTTLLKMYWSIHDRSKYYVPVSKKVLCMLDVDIVK